MADETKAAVPPLPEGEVSLDDARPQARSRDFSNKKANTFRPEVGRVYRIRMMSEKVVMRLRHFLKGKRYLRCLSYLGYCPACLTKKEGVKSASEGYGTNIWVYSDTDAEGNYPEGTTPKGTIHFWAFGSDKFVQLRGIKSEWGTLINIDLKVTCIDPQFNKLNITPCKASPCDTNPKLLAHIQSEFKKEAYPVEKFLCKEATPVQMVETYELEHELAIAPNSVAGSSIQDKAAEISKETKSSPGSAPDSETVDYDDLLADV